MDLQYRREATVGLLVLVAIGIFIMGFLWLKGKQLFGDQQLTRVRFEDVGGLKAGDPVLVSGVNVGRVARIELVELGEVFVHIEVGPRWRPRRGAWAQVVAIGFVGDQALEYWPGRDGEWLADTAAVEGRDAGGGFGELAVRADTLLGNVQQLLSQQLARDVHNTLVATERAMRAVAALGDGPAVRQATSTLAALERTAARLDTTLAEPDLRTALRGLDDVTQSMNEMMQGLAGATGALYGILARVEQGEGTLGRLSSDSVLYQELRRATTALADLLEDVKARPGRYLPDLKVF